MKFSKRLKIGEDDTGTMYRIVPRWYTLVGSYLLTVLLFFIGGMLIATAIPNNFAYRAAAIIAWLVVSVCVPSLIMDKLIDREHGEEMPPFVSTA